MGSKRPKISEAARAFKEVYDSIGGTVEAVGRKIGGKVDYNINRLPENQKFKNACAIRLSYVLNKTGFKILQIPNETVSGKEGNWYIYRVKTMMTHLEKTFGAPDFTYIAPTPEKLSANRGILVFEVDGWNDATGHATIWNGIGCSDKCYFEKAKKVHLWILDD
jgi:hypothetical protein